MAVIAALPFSSVMAQKFTQEQIDAIVAKAVDKALADRRAKNGRRRRQEGGSGNQPANHRRFAGYGDSIRSEV